MRQTRSAVEVAAARTLRTYSVDLVSAEVATALHAAGVDNLLLKGPTFARWLYGEGESREYDDTDLLVRLDGIEPAETVLCELGFEKLLDSSDQCRHARHAHTWARPTDGGAVVDLHWTLPGVRTPAEKLWHELACRTETEEVAGQPLDCMDTGGRAFHVALHAAQHGPRHDKPVEDLRRALVRCNKSAWAEAAALAWRLEATCAFGAGLRLLPEGARLADRLGVPPNGSVMVALFAEHSDPRLAMGIQSLLEESGVRAKAEILSRALWPTPRFMRAAFPRACRSRAGLGLAYLWRPAWLLAHAPRALLGVRQARRAARKNSP